MPCAVRLGYGNGNRLIATWAGLVTVPAPPRVSIIHTGPGAYSIVPAAAGIPVWAIALLIIGALLLAAMAVLLLRQHRRREATRRTGEMPRRRRRSGVA